VKRDRIERLFIPNLRNLGLQKIQQIQTWRGGYFGEEPVTSVDARSVTAKYLLSPQFKFIRPGRRADTGVTKTSHRRRVIWLAAGPQHSLATGRLGNGADRM
jgi:hypothetical protein